MDSQSQVASYEKRMQFLLSVLQAEEKRRDAAENKSSILIASNAILLGAMTGFLLPLNNTGAFIFWIQVFLTIFVFGAVILSVMISAQVLAPFTTQEQRTRIMDLGSNPGSEYNLFLFARIAVFKKEEYQKEIDVLSEKKILEQIIWQVHNLSRLLRVRYQYMGWAHFAFIVGLVAFAFLSSTKLFTP